MFAPPEWEFTGNGRFDDPDKEVGDPAEGRFRVIYCASGREAAFGETIARFRRSIGLLAALEDIEDDEALGSDLEGGLLPEDWRLNRRIGASRLEPALRFVDFECPNTLKGLRRGLAPILAGLGVEDLDFSDLIGRDRRLTQRAAKYIYDATDDVGKPAFCGIRYASRLNREWELWAVFADRMLHAPENLYQTIPRDDPDLLRAANVLDIEIR